MVETIRSWGFGAFIDSFSAFIEYWTRHDVFPLRVLRAARRSIIEGIFLCWRDAWVRKVSATKSNFAMISTPMNLISSKCLLASALNDSTIWWKIVITCGVPMWVKCVWSLCGLVGDENMYERNIMKRYIVGKVQCALGAADDSSTYLLRLWFSCHQAELFQLWISRREKNLMKKKSSRIDAILACGWEMSYWLAAHDTQSLRLVWSGLFSQHLAMHKR
jgi:hypothetical protein